MQVEQTSACWFRMALIGECPSLAALQGGQAGARDAVCLHGAGHAGVGGMPRYNEFDAGEGGRGNGLTCREA